ncbi:MAG: hypothetical protein COA73_09540 [Candidatus Hydrogenedentota bacterium]|nr:MAG: hypothetical protein COA73_09540 [Candidatus Hydrogenedentota bacterium]
MARKKPEPVKVVDMDQAAKALAKTIADGDIVDFNTLFLSWSPARSTSPETLESDKFDFVRPTAEEESSEQFRAALDAVKQSDTWSHVKQEFAANRPAQLPSDLLLMLADNAVREQKYTAAAQAYELLRIRRKMMTEFLDQADALLAQGNIPGAVRGYRIGVGLEYDYAAFPDPLPAVPRFQVEAMAIHAQLPQKHEDCISLQDDTHFADLALHYLLDNDDAASRLTAQPVEVRQSFLQELIQQLDPEWDTFANQYKAACSKVQEYGDRLKEQSGTLSEEIEEQQGPDPREIMAALLGREIVDGEWWQYLRELAYEHPAGILFITRQKTGDHEIIMPVLRAEATLPDMLGIVPENVSV